MMPNRPPMHRGRRGAGRDVAAGRAYDRRRGPDRQWYSSRRWRRFRRWKLGREPLCARCGAAATEVHHVAARRERVDLAFDDGNTVSLCKGCHNRAEKGGG